MKQAIKSVDQRKDEILADAVLRELEITITHRITDSWRTYRASFVACDEGKQFICTTKPKPKQDVPAVIPPIGAALGVTFRLGHKKCMFSTTREPVPLECDQNSFAIAWPDHLQHLQRRAYKRVSPPAGVVVSVQFWRVSLPASEDRKKREVYYGELEDISAGGMRVDAAHTAAIDAGQSCECLFVPRPGEAPIILDAILRYKEDAGHDRASLGFQFVGLETSFEGREMLARLARVVSDYQNHRNRR